MLQHERKEQQDHFQPPLYMEGELEEHAEEVIESQENQLIAYFDDEEGELTLEEEK